jgi:hypothetical protein
MPYKYNQEARQATPYKNGYLVPFIANKKRDRTQSPVPFLQTVGFWLEQQPKSHLEAAWCPAPDGWIGDLHVR